MIDVAVQLLALVGVLVGVFFAGKRSQKARHDTEERNRTIATQKRITDAIQSAPSSDADVDEWLRNRSKR